MNKPIVVDLFCGAGGESSGLMQAYNEFGIGAELYAVNHWELAIETHSLNHPDAKHYPEDIFKGTARKHIKNRKVALLWASPECIYHSRARGKEGPCNEQSRAGAYAVNHWCSEMLVERVIVENVAEFIDWGPVDKNGKRIKDKKGLYFRKWVKSLQKMGYIVDWRVLCAADFGTPTSRKRVFVQAVHKDSGKKIVWPKPTHTQDQWLPAACIIDWNDLGTPLSQRKRPLVDNTLKRIALGVEKHWGEYAEPYLVILRGTSTTRSVDMPLPTVTAGGRHFGLVCPIDNKSAKGGARSADQPLSTIVTKQKHALVTPLVMGQHSGSHAHPADSSPVPTVTTVPRVQLVTPLIMSYYGNGSCTPLTRPLPTVTTRERFAMASGLGFDLGFRMLSPSELSRAQGFEKSYKFAGNKTQVTKQIGNAVPPPFAYHQVKPYVKELAA